MQVQQQGRTPALAQRIERPGKAGVIGLVDTGDAGREFLFLVAPLPQFAQPRQAARYQAQTAAIDDVDWEMFRRAAGTESPEWYSSTRSCRSLARLDQYPDYDSERQSGFPEVMRKFSCGPGLTAVPRPASAE